MTSTPSRLLATVLGAVYLVVGAVGFAVTGGTGLTSTEGATLLVFEVNPLHNVVHLGVGAALLVAARRSAAAARGTCLAVGAVYLLVGVAGLFLVDSPANLLALNGADNVLHLASALVLLGVALADRRAPVVRTA